MSLNTKAVHKTIYCELPESTRSNNEDVLIAMTPEEKKSKDVLFKYIEEVVPEEEVNDQLREDLRYKVHYLDNVDQIKKHKFEKSAAKRKTLSAKERRKLKLLKLSREEQHCQYSDYLPLHYLWQDYMRDLLKIDKLTPKNFPDAEAKLLKADYHGALLTATASKEPSLVGQMGIVAMETKNTFQVITKDNKLKTLPKRGTNFTVTIDGYAITLYGNQLLVKSCVRTARKFKGKPSVDL